jgi:Trk K+ transport system NAD-binding subunit
MKTLPSQLLFFFKHKTTRRNFSTLWKFFGTLVFIICFYSVLFQVLMMHEERSYSWISGFYWTLTVMSTLGFGDITFHSDLGKLFSMFVLFSGVVLLLILLPFVFIQFFYTPWLEAQERARTPRELPEEIKDHIIITNVDPITTRLIETLTKQAIPYVIVTADLVQANELMDQGYKVVVGEPDIPKTYQRLRIDNAALVVVTNDDLTSTNICFTIREVNKEVPIITSADQEYSIDILEFSGNTSVFQFTKMLGESLAKRTLGVGRTSNIIGRFSELLISEMSAKDSGLAGKTLAESGIRQFSGVTVIGMMEKGKFKVATPRTLITPQTILMLAGTNQQLNAFDEQFTLRYEQDADEVQVLILGGGRVGQAAADILHKHGIGYRIIEKDLVQAKESMHRNITVGDAADLNTLKTAGLESARSVIVTTRSDEMNIYLTFYCRQLRHDIQIISRSILERNVTKLHMAGADLVMSYASLGAGIIFQHLKPDEMSLFTEGPVVFNRKAGKRFAGKTIINSGIREKTGCSIIVIRRNDHLLVSPSPAAELQEDDELYAIGTMENEKLFQAL